MFSSLTKNDYSKKNRFEPLTPLTSYVSKLQTPIISASRKNPGGLLSQMNLSRLNLSSAEKQGQMLGRVNLLKNSLNESAKFSAQQS